LSTLPDPLVREPGIQRNFDALAARIRPPDFVTTLASSPSVGTEVYYAHSQGFWHLKFYSDSYWYFLGGVALYTQDPNTRTGTTASTYDTTGAPSVTLPLAGDYDIEFGAQSVLSVEAGTNDGRIGLHVNGTLTNQAFWRMTASGQGSAGSTPIRRTGITAGHVVAARYSGWAGLDVAFSQLFISAIPVRVQG